MHEPTTKGKIMYCKYCNAQIDKHRPRPVLSMSIAAIVYAILTIAHIRDASYMSRLLSSDVSTGKYALIAFVVTTVLAFLILLIINNIRDSGYVPVWKNIAIKDRLKANCIAYTGYINVLLIMAISAGNRPTYLNQTADNIFFALCIILPLIFQGNPYFTSLKDAVMVDVHTLIIFMLLYNEEKMYIVAEVLYAIQIILTVILYMKNREGNLLADPRICEATYKAKGSSKTK